jgi:PleD family two-component response regulator
MATPEAAVLIAAPPAVVSKLKAGLPDHVHVMAAETYDDALARLGERPVDLLIVCYVFDDVRPYRLLNHLQALSERPPAMLVRALPIPLRENEEDVRAAYAPLGVREFQNFSDQEKREGTQAALAQFGRLVLGLIRGLAGAK